MIEEAEGQKDERQVFNAAIFRRGQKKELFDDKQEDATFNESDELRAKLGDLCTLWSAARTGRDLSAAIWRPKLGVAEVVLQKGKLLTHMGFQKGSRLYLHIEEAVYLVDRTNLLLFLEPSSKGAEQQLLSLQEAYDLMVGSGVSCKLYLIYAKLMRAGYIVRRHPGCWVLRVNEDPREVWREWCSRRASPPSDPLPSRDPPLGNQHPQGPEGQQPAVPEKGKGTHGGQTSSAPSALLGKAGKGRKQGSGGQGPGVAGLGGGIERRKRKREQDPSQLRHGRWWQGNDVGKGAALPWLAMLPLDYGDSLPRCEVAPNSSSAWVSRFPAMASLSAIPDASLFLERTEEQDAGLLDFDVWEPNARFARRAAGPPAFRALLASGATSAFHACSDPVPSFPGLQDMAAADRASSGVPIKFVTVENGDIAFYGLGQADLQCLL